MAEHDLSDLFREMIERDWNPTAEETLARIEGLQRTVLALQDVVDVADEVRKMAEAAGEGPTR